jgi:hypothetical protein
MFGLLMVSLVVGLAAVVTSRCFSCSWFGNDRRYVRGDGADGGGGRVLTVVWRVAVTVVSWRCVSCRGGGVAVVVVFWWCRR